MDLNLGSAGVIQKACCALIQLQPFGGFSVVSILNFGAVTKEVKAIDISIKHPRIIQISC